MIEIPKLPKPEGGDKAPRWFHVAVALSMVLSAGAALVSALRTSDTMKGLVEQNARLVKAGSTPILQLHSANLGEDRKSELSLTVENVGTGPARVVWLEMSVAGKPLRSARELPQRSFELAKVDIGPDVPIYTATGSIVGDVLSAGHKRVLFSWRAETAAEPKARHAFEVMNKQFGTLDMQTTACYCSVFEECWETQFDGRRPKPVAGCEPEGHVLLNG